MFKFLTKQLIYGRIYLWVKDKLGAILFLFISIFLIIYFHNEYLNYIEYKEKFAESYVGLSFVIKNILILLVAGGFFYFYFSNFSKQITVMQLKSKMNSFPKL